MLGIVKTINGVKQIVPLTTDSGQGLPLGAITAFYGTTPPNGYLICDGSEFPQAQYPALYTFLGDNHTPDLRGEFLRGAGTNSHTNQGSGGSVGEHQDATCIPWVTANTVQHFITAGVDPSNYDSYYDDTHTQTQISNGLTGGKLGVITTRPTNTSVNFIIKAVIGPIEDSAADQVVQNINNSRSYSTEEVNTGEKWIDGKPIYRKVITGWIPYNTSSYDVSSLNIDNMIDIGGFIIQNNGNILKIPYNTGSGDVMLIYLNSAKDYLGTIIAGSYATTEVTVIIKYTKTTDQATV